MKICHVTSVHNRYDGRIFEKECTSLAKMGYDVTLLCVDNLKDEEKNNVKIRHIELNYKNKFDRILNSSRKIYQKALEINADVYHLHDPELILLGKKLLKNNKKIIFDSHEDYPNLIMSKTWIKKPIRKIISKYYERLEKRIYPKFTALISVSPHIVNRLKLLNKNTYMITNYPIYKKINKAKFDNYICFAGGITSQWSHSNILEALNDIDTTYKIAGKLTPSYEEILKSSPSYSKVTYLGNITKEEVAKLYKNASLGLALCQESANVNYHEGSLGNTKLFEYMANGIPVICTNFVLWEKIINEYKCGICVNPNNINEINTAIKKILSNPALQQEMSKNGIKAIKDKYNWQNEEKILYEIYNKINEVKNE